MLEVQRRLYEQQSRLLEMQRRLQGEQSPLLGVQRRLEGEHPRLLEVERRSDEEQKFFPNASALLPTPHVDFSSPDGENRDRLGLSL